MVSSTANSIMYTGDGVTTTFSFPYYFFKLPDLKVALYDTLAGGITTLVSGTDFTPSGTANTQGLYPSGGQITMLTSVPPTTTMLVIWRDGVQTNVYSLGQNGNISSAALTQQFDYVTLLIQRLESQIGNTIQVPDGLGNGFSGLLPNTIGVNPNMYLRVNSTGTGIGLDPGLSPTSFLNPMTTLGDLIYESSTPAATRLPGNTTAIKKYLSQTGTGTVSAVPAWAQPAFADLSGTATIAQGGTGQTSVTGIPAASSYAGWDANKNLTASGFIPQFTTTATAAGTTTLTIASTQLQVFTGSTTQTVKLPTASVAQGQSYTVINQSTGSVTVQSSGANTIQILLPGSQGNFTALVATPTTATNWLVAYQGIGGSGYKAPTIQTFTSSSGTYTTPTGPSPLYLLVTVVGGGGGGGGLSTTAGTAGSATTFGTSLLTANGGAGGAISGNGGAGGTVTGNGNGIAIPGGAGEGTILSSLSSAAGGAGGSNAYFGGPTYAPYGSGTQAAGNNAATNTGCGGSGATGLSAAPSAGGGAGGYIKTKIFTPASTYAYSVGAGGAGGTGGVAGGNGAAGIIIVEEYYQ